MPGYVIHLAIAEKYLEKNKNEKYNDFIDGVIYPDEINDKYKTHYWNEMRSVNLYNFLKENKIDTSFNRGYFLHLLTDYLFYNKYIEYWSTDIYTDYDILNPYLLKKYDVKLPARIKKYVHVAEQGKSLKILSKEVVDKFIKDLSNLDLEYIKEEITKYPEEWTEVRTLKEP